MTIEIADRLCAYRKQRGLSQEELAEKIGVSRQAVSKWERAEASPDTDNLIALAAVYGVTLDDLLYTDPAPAAPDTGTAQTPPDDRISFQNGIHVHAQNGDQVDIGFSGIHVDAPTENTQVHIDRTGIFVKETGVTHVHSGAAEHIFAHHRDKRAPGLFPYSTLCILLYILFGCLGICGGWSAGWIILLTIPLYHSLVSAVSARRPQHFAYPVAAALFYLYCGLFHSVWHPTWLVFLTIPLYYSICHWLTGSPPDGEN